MAKFRIRVPASHAGSAPSQRTQEFNDRRFLICFDTSAVRSLANLRRRDWERIASRAKLLSGYVVWSRWAIVELLSTNLRQRDLSVTKLRELQRCVRRYSTLAKKNVLNDDNKHFITSAYRAAGVPVPTLSSLGVPEIRGRDLLDHIDRFLKLTNPEQVLPLESGMVLRDASLLHGVEMLFPSGFHDFATHVQSAIQKFLGPLPKEKKLDRQAEVASQIFQHLFIEKAKHLNIPSPVYIAAITTALAEGLRCVDFTGMMIESFYHSRVAMSLESIAASSKKVENTGRDLRIAESLSRSWLLATEDASLANRVNSILSDRRAIDVATAMHVLQDWNPNATFEI